jgi:hypothetical protein
MPENLGSRHLFQQPGLRKSGPSLAELFLGGPPKIGNVIP